MWIEQQTRVGKSNSSDVPGFQDPSRLMDHQMQFHPRLARSAAISTVLETMERMEKTGVSIMLVILFCEKLMASFESLQFMYCHLLSLTLLSFACGPMADYKEYNSEPLLSTKRDKIVSGSLRGC